MRGHKQLVSTHESTFGLASVNCRTCQGAGLVNGQIKLGYTGPVPCKCVLRAIFRACYNRYREGILGRRASVDYCADFYLIAKRILNEHEMAVFQLFFLRELPWYNCVCVLKLDRGNFFHRVYEIEQKLGQAFRDTRPYALFPLYAYFSNNGGMPMYAV